MDDHPGPAEMSASKRLSSWFKSALLTAGAVAALAALIAWAGAGRLEAAFRGIGWRGAAELFAIYAFSQLVRVARYRMMFRGDPRPPGLGDLCAVVSLHQVGNHILPARMGELTFPYLLRRSSGTPVERSLSILLTIRLQEVAVLAGLFVGALAFVGPGMAGHSGASPLRLAGAGIAVIALVAAFEWMLPRMLGAASRWLSRPGSLARLVVPARWAERLQGTLARLAQEAARPMRLGRRAALMGLTLLLWLSMFFLFHALMRMSGYDVTYLQTIVGSSFANFSQLLPINTFGSLGSLEAGWTLGFSLVRVPADGALATAVALHVLVLGFLAVTALPAWIWLRSRRAG